MALQLNEYQDLAAGTAVYPDEMSVIYPALGLAGESGEVCEKIKKLIRDDGGELTEERRKALVKELGDVLWYLAALANDIDVTLESVARQNVEKLYGRKGRGTLHGDGDNR